MHICYRRTENNDLRNILLLFLKTFNKKISLNYYKSRYLKKNFYNSFVAYNNNQLVGHVAFVENVVIFSTLKKYIVYARHTSMVKINMRRKNIYTNLCNFAYNNLIKKNVLGIVTFPNK